MSYSFAGYREYFDRDPWMPLVRSRRSAGGSSIQMIELEQPAGAFPDPPMPDLSIQVCTRATNSVQDQAAPGHGSDFGLLHNVPLHNPLTAQLCFRLWDEAVGDLAAAAGLSPVHFGRAFRAATSVTPHRYLLQQRVTRAQHLLTSTDLPIAEVALDCGFCHQSHLTTVFRRITGTTPAAYRATARC